MRFSVLYAVNIAFSEINMWESNHTTVLCFNYLRFKNQRYISQLRGTS